MDRHEKSPKMGDEKHPSFIKSLSDSILIKNGFNYSSRYQTYHQVCREESETRKYTVGDIEAGYPELIRFGGSLTILATVLTIILIYWPSNARINQTVIYNEAIVKSFDGWGTSLAWWAEFIGSLDDQKRQDFLSRVFHPSNEDSLQFNIIRFNMGGAPKILPNGTTPEMDFAPFKGIPSMQLANKTYDWDADAFQLAVVRDIMDLNNDSLIIEAFSNSPPYWMTKSQNSMGNIDGSDNLDAANYTMFADYITTVIDYAINNLNIPIQYVEPFNEPDYNWRIKPDFQEGNHWDKRSMQSFLPVLHSSLKSKNLDQKVHLSISDSWSVREALSSLNLFDNFEYKANVHGYGYYMPFHIWDMDDYIQKARQKNNIKKIWMSESGGYGLGNAGVADFALDVINHLNILEAEAWIYWQVLDQTSSWALILVSDRYPWWLSKFNYYPSNTILFYTMQQFSNHIKPGYRILKTSQSSYKSDCSPVCVLAASSPTKKIVLILLNTSPKAIDHDINIPEDLIIITNQTKIESYRTTEWNMEYHKKIHNHIIIRPKNWIHLVLHGLSVITIELY